MVAGDHFDGDTHAASLLDGSGSFGTESVGDSDKALKAEDGVFVQAAQLVDFMVNFGAGDGDNFVAFAGELYELRLNVLAGGLTDAGAV